MCIAQFKDIPAWEKACELTSLIYHQTFNPKLNKLLRFKNYSAAALNIWSVKYSTRTSPPDTSTSKLLLPMPSEITPPPTSELQDSKTPESQDFKTGVTTRLYILALVLVLGFSSIWLLPEAGEIKLSQQISFLWFLFIGSLMISIHVHLTCTLHVAVYWLQWCAFYEKNTLNWTTYKLETIIKSSKLQDV